MKLYTEEQIREALKAGFRLAMETDGGLNDYIELFMNALTPIELPTDEEIDKEATYREPNNTRRAFFSGSKYVIEQIKKQK